MSEAAWEKAVFGGALLGKPRLFNNPGMLGFLHDDLELGLRVACSLDVEEAYGAADQYWWLAIGNDMYEDEMRQEEEGRNIETAAGDVW